MRSSIFNVLYCQRSRHAPRKSEHGKDKGRYLAVGGKSGENFCNSLHSACLDIMQILEDVGHALRNQKAMIRQQEFYQRQQAMQRQQQAQAEANRMRCGPSCTSHIPHRRCQGIISIF